MQRDHLRARTSECKQGLRLFPKKSEEQPEVDVSNCYFMNPVANTGDGCACICGTGASLNKASTSKWSCAVDGKGLNGAYLYNCSMVACCDISDNFLMNIMSRLWKRTSRLHGKKRRCTKGTRVASLILRFPRKVQIGF